MPREAPRSSGAQRHPAVHVQPCNPQTHALGACHSRPRRSDAASPGTAVTRPGADSRAVALFTFLSLT